jgi:hypothetical protein
MRESRSWTETFLKSRYGRCDLKLLDCSPEAAIAEPLRSLEPVGIASGRVVHDPEHERHEGLTVATDEFADARPETGGPAAWVAASTREKTATGHAAERCSRAVLNGFHEKLCKYRARPCADAKGVGGSGRQ